MKIIGPQQLQLKLAKGFYPLVSSEGFCHVLSRCIVNGHDQPPNYVQHLGHHPTSMYNKLNKVQCNMMSHPFCFLSPE